MPRSENRYKKSKKTRPERARGQRTDTRSDIQGWRGEHYMRTFVATDHFVAKCKAGHEAALLEPKDGAETAREKDALDGGKADEPLGKGVEALLVDPLHRPVGLFPHRRHRVDGTKEVVLFGRVLDIGVDQERIGLLVVVIIVSSSSSSSSSVSLSSCVFRHGQSVHGAARASRVHTKERPR